MTPAETLGQPMPFAPLMALVLFATVTIFGIFALRKYREVKSEE